MKYIFYIYMSLLAILLLITLPYAWKLFNILFMSPRIPVLSQLELYKWTSVGIFGALVLGHVFNKNLLWLETFSHELTHIVVAFIFFRKVHSFHAEEGSGVVYTSGTDQKGLIPMALAPYCLPIFTYFLLLFRSLMDFHGVWVFDIIIGASIAFHIACFRHQTGNHQTDINQYPLLFSYSYIYIARLINFCIILVAFFPHYNVFTSIWRLLNAQYDNIMYFWSLLF